MTRRELENILSKKGFILQKVGNLYQVKSKSLKTIYQSHNFDDISTKLGSLSGFYTQGEEYSKETINKPCMTVFGRTTIRP